MKFWLSTVVLFFASLGAMKRSFDGGAQGNPSKKANKYDAGPPVNARFIHCCQAGDLETFKDIVEYEVASRGPGNSELSNNPGLLRTCLAYCLDYQNYGVMEVLLKDHMDQIPAGYLIQAARQILPDMIALMIRSGKEIRFGLCFDYQDGFDSVLSSRNVQIVRMALSLWPKQALDESYARRALKYHRIEVFDAVVSHYPAARLPAILQDCLFSAMGLGSTCLIRHIFGLLGDGVPPEDGDSPATANRYVQIWNALKASGNTQSVLQLIKACPRSGVYLLCFAVKVCLGHGRVDDLLELLAAGSTDFGYLFAVKGAEMLSVAVSTGNLAALMDARVHPDLVEFEQLAGFTKRRLQAHDLIRGFVNVIDAAPKGIQTRWVNRNFRVFRRRVSRSRGYVIYHLVKSIMAGSPQRLLVFSEMHPFELGVIDFCWSFLLTSGRYDFFLCNLLPAMQDNQRAAIQGSAPS